MTDASHHGTTKLVSYFSVLNYSLVSQEEKLMVSLNTLVLNVPRTSFINFRKVSVNIEQFEVT